ncbi:hypothetical protein GCM10027515_09500 [Schumannella luteola]|uniref:Dihydrofolate reductase n=1 Tax=Schumannella luteola TaxID=472059 RepID=A0A852YHZ7_9MICO|nr:dihydrofolate reductase family protein [Schumannella luteola]NYG97399.1 dihydrofolate reductase [Schumannella luteola]TPX01645.1 hypothetical protein FJ656_26400 [Schumannella luteola]
MSEIVVQEFMTLDGVIQGPGGDGEDEEGDFPYSGWQMDYDADAADGSGADDAADGAADGTAGDEGDGLIAEWESRTGALLLGRKTYDIWARAWGVWSEDEPGLMGEFTRRYNRVTKFVASSTLTDPTWKNTVVVRDVASEVSALKQRTDIDGEIRVWGSADLIRSLGEHDLVDEYRLSTRSCSARARGCSPRASPSAASAWPRHDRSPRARSSTSTGASATDAGRVGSASGTLGRRMRADAGGCGRSARPGVACAGVTASVGGSTLAT